MSTPIFDPDDPRLTAYALDESSNAAERLAVEELLAASPEARAIVEQARAMARLLEEDFAHENALYQKAHPPMAMPANIIRFPGSQRRWTNVVAVGGAVAAVIAALAVLVLPAVRRTPVAAVATVQPVLPPAAKEVAPMPSVDAAAPTDSRPLLAAASEPEAHGGAEPTAGQPLDLDKDRPAEMKTQSDQFAAARPGAARSAPAAAAAAPMPPGASTPGDRPAAAIVRVRLQNGTFVGGVLLTADGRMLAAREFSKNETQGAAILLPDGRQFPGRTVNTGSFFSGRQLRITAAGLPHVSLAAELPGDKTLLEVARVDEREGTVSFVKSHADQVSGQLAADGGALVFNAAGELLATEVMPSLAKSAGRTRTAIRRDDAAPTTVRPFTAAERAALTGPAK